MLRRRVGILAGIVVLIGVVVVGVGTLLAPDNSAVIFNSQQAPDCLTGDSGTCLVLPGVSGTNLSGDTVTFPEALTTRYTLLVMPFTDEQQTQARDWLAPFQSLAGESADVSYANLAALPDLAPVVRSLVLGGMRVGVQDDALREVIVVAFLDDQAAFLEALGIPDTETMQLFIVGEDGTIYGQAAGAYDPDTEADLRDQLAALMR